MSNPKQVSTKMSRQTASPVNIGNHGGVRKEHPANTVVLYKKVKVE